MNVHVCICVWLGLVFLNTNTMTEKPWTDHTALLFIYSLPMVVVLAHNLTKLISINGPLIAYRKQKEAVRSNEDDLFSFFGPMR